MQVMSAALQPGRLFGLKSSAAGCPRRPVALRPLATAASNGSLAATMVRPAQPAPAAQPSQLPQTGSLTKPSETAELLMTKEELLKELLEPRPGKIPPKASMVAGLRKEIASLRQRLRAEVAGGPAAELTYDATPAAATASAYIPSPGTLLAGAGVPQASDAEEEEGIAAEGEDAEAAAAGPSGLSPNGFEEPNGYNGGPNLGVPMSVLNSSALATAAARTLSPAEGLGVSQGAASRVRKALRMVEQRLGSEAASGVAFFSEEELATSGGSSNGTAVNGAANGRANGYANGYTNGYARPAAAAAAAVPALEAVAERVREKLQGEELLTAAEQLQLEVLYIENARLKARAEALLAREAQLKAMIKKKLAAERGETVEEEAAAAEAAAVEAAAEAAAVEAAAEAADVEAAAVEAAAEAAEEATPEAPGFEVAAAVEVAEREWAQQPGEQQQAALAGAEQ